MTSWTRQTPSGRLVEPAPSRPAWYGALAVAAVAGLLAGADVPAAAQGLTAAVALIDVAVERVPLDPADPQRDRLGELIYRGGLRLSSSDPRFGGLSALLIQAPGRTFLSVSDRGYWVAGSLGYADDGTLIDVSGITVEPIKGPAGQWLTMRPWRDAESLAVSSDGGLIVAFEDAHRLWRYSARTAGPSRLAPPPRLYRAPENGGIEALTVLSGGGMFALAEDLETEGGVVGWIGNPVAGWTQFTYAVEGGYRPTGAATVPQLGVLVLERRFPPLGVRLRLVPERLLVPDALGARPVIEAGEVATFNPGMSMDNFEGVDVLITDDGRRLVYVVSDDNFSVLQSTLLLMFEWPVDPAVPPGAGGTSVPGR